MENLKFIQKISSLKELDYQKLIKNDDNPFIQYAFLDSLENSKSVSIKNGWQPNHLISFNKILKGFMPLYIKNNSQGEFVFDHSWSYALSRAGREYYPKLLTAVPFTPCQTKKFLQREFSLDFIDKTKSFMDDKDIETWHILFPDKALGNKLKENDFIERYGYKFIWQNKNYSCFDDYLSVFKSRQRKNIKSERKKIKDLGITFDIKELNNITKEDWEIFYDFYKITYHQRMQVPYLNKKFFEGVHKNKSILKPIIFFAVYKNKKIAGSLCFKSKKTLYGRHWGSSYNINSLHFECCYYQGIEYCIKNKIDTFDPGVQGEHKIRRGFEPQKSSSYHYIHKEDLRGAILDFCNKEEKEIDRYIEACNRYTPFKKEYKIK